MNEEAKYKVLFDFVSLVEEEDECPWCAFNAWFNTTPSGEIDMETPSGAIVTDDIEEIEELLEKDNLFLDFVGDRPVIKEKEWEVRFQ